MRSTSEASAPSASSRDEDAAPGSSGKAATGSQDQAVDVQAQAVKSSSATASTQTVSSHPLEAGDYEDGGDDLFASRELINELKDTKSLGNRGEALFFAQVAVIALVVFPPFALKGLVDLVGTLSVTSGAVFIAYALVSLGRNLSPLPQPRKKHTLVTSGMYSYLRHPMYGGLLLVALGLAALTRSETRLALTALLWWILEQKVDTEERFLTERYPDTYAAYKAQVKKFIPFIY